MKDEIKEILDRLFVYRNENDEMKYQPEDILTIEDVWLLLDYITNLQEENDRLNKVIISNHKELESLFNHLTKKDLNYKSRNEKANDYINSTDFIYDEQYKKKDKLENILNGDDND